MSVGHVARAIEAEGIPTVIVGVQSFAGRTTIMTPPRLLLTPHLMGRPFGAPFDEEGHRDVVMAALGLLETAVSVGTVQKWERPYQLPE